MFKKSLVVLLALVMVFALAACNSGGSEPAASSNGEESANKGGEEKGSGQGEQVELTFWLFGAAGYEKLAEEYMSEHPNIKIDFQSQKMEDHHNSLFTALSAGSGAPDIAMIEVGSIERFKQAPDKFYNLYDFGAGDIEDQYLDWKWKVGSSADGSFLFGLPTDIGPTAMFYRTDVFEEAGLPTEPDAVSEQIATWDDFKNTAIQIKESTGKYMSDSVQLVYNALRDQQPMQYFDAEDNLIIEEEPYIKKAYDYTVELIEAGVIAENDLWTPDWSNGMNKPQGEADYATLLGAAWMQGYMEGNAPEAKGLWRVADMPEGAGNWGGSYLAIPKESEHAEEAYAFIEWLVSPENQLKSFKSNGLFPSAPSVYEKEEFQNHPAEYYGGQEIAQVLARSAEQVEYVYKGVHYQPVDREIVNALVSVQREGADPEEAWKQAVERAKRIVNK